MANHTTSMVEKYARRYGVPIPLAQRMLSKESGGNPNAVSPKNAVGLLQIHLPSHPEVTPQQARDPDFNLNYGFSYLRKLKDEFGSWRLALAAYNAGPGAVKKYGGVPPYRETQDYVRNILRAAGALQSSPSGTTRAGWDSGGLATPPAPPQPDLSGLDALRQGRYDPTAQLQALLAGSSNGRTPGSEPGGGGSSPSPAVPISKDVDPGKWVVLGRGADRQGASTQAPVIGFVAQVAQAYGKPLTIGTGTNHSQMTVNGRESHHWTGMAADIPASGKTLKRLGYLALMAAGIPKGDAFKAAQRGGLFNIGNYQIIFATNKGGDHTGHIHIGIREG